MFVCVSLRPSILLMQQELWGGRRPGAGLGVRVVWVGGDDVRPARMVERVRLLKPWAGRAWLLVWSLSYVKPGDEPRCSFFPERSPNADITLKPFCFGPTWTALQTSARVSMCLAWQSAVKMSPGDSLGMRCGSDPPPRLWANHASAGRWRTQIKRMEPGLVMAWK